MKVSFSQWIITSWLAFALTLAASRYVSRTIVPSGELFRYLHHCKEQVAKARPGRASMHCHLSASFTSPAVARRTPPLRQPLSIPYLPEAYLHHLPYSSTLCQNTRTVRAYPVVKDTLVKRPFAAYFNVKYRQYTLFCVRSGTAYYRALP